MKPKLSILIYSLAGGGAERVVSILLQELREGYDISLVLMRDKIDYNIPPDIQIHLLENSKPDEHGIMKLLKLPYLGWKYKTFCQKNGTDLSLVFMNRPSYVAIFSKLFGNKIPTIISERTTPSRMYSADTVLAKVSRWLIRNLYPQSDCIISNSEGNRVDLIENFSIESQKIKTIYNPFDLEKIEQLSIQEVEKIDFTKFTFISVGRLDSGKNHQLMINAFAKLKDENIQLIILGEGGLEEKLREQIRVLGLEYNVFLLGFDSNPYKYFSKSDVFVFTSNYEGFPNVLVEALACGVPVISTDCMSGPREILAPSSDVHTQIKKGLECAAYGLLVPINREDELKGAMELLMNDKNLLETYRKKAKNRAKSFNKSTIVNEFIQTVEGEF